MDIASAPWLTFGANPQPPEVTPKLGWMNESVEIDPFNSNRMMYGTGATLYGTTNLTNWDAGTQITIKPMVTGPGGDRGARPDQPAHRAPRWSAGLGDIGGFRHTNLDAVPSMMFTAAQLHVARPASTTPRPTRRRWCGPATSPTPTGPTTATSPSPPTAARTGSRAPSPAASTAAARSPRPPTAAGSSGRPGDAGQQVVFSVGFGNSWTAVHRRTGELRRRVRPGQLEEVLRVQRRALLRQHQRRRRLHPDRGHRPADHGQRALQGAAGHRGRHLAGRRRRATGRHGLWHSTNSGASFTKVSNVTEGRQRRLRQGRPGPDLPGALPRRHGRRRQGRATGPTTPAGTWVRINDDAHQYGNAGEAITGDPRVYGRVYLGTNGRGILYADRQGSATTPPPDTTAPTTPGTPTASSVTSTGATLTVDGVDGRGWLRPGRVRRDQRVEHGARHVDHQLGHADRADPVHAVRAAGPGPDGAGNLSTASGSVTFTTLRPVGHDGADHSGYADRVQCDLERRHPGLDGVDG